jgi:hypothetical protein
METLSRKYAGFPRKDGHCKSHDISIIIKDLFKFEYKNFATMLYDSNHELHGIILRTILNKLIKTGVDLVRGDIICDGLDGHENDGVCIFDGENIIPLCYDIDDYGSLPLDFTVIHDNVSIRYWETIYDERDNVIVRGITHNSFVSFHLNSNIRIELIRNIKRDNVKYFKRYGAICYDEDQEKEIIYTSLVLNNRKYYFVIISQENDNKIIINKFIDLMTIKNNLILNYLDVGDVFYAGAPENLTFIYIEGNEDL